ncbi:MAG: XRE family transcriptional regulator, partial [Schwartzia sp.]|nr:XRE family transcriptional regulator [Schwartzia sp. (in: firmicutes)]
QIERGERNITLDKLITLTNRLGVTVDFLLNDYVTAANEDLYQKIMLQLFDGRSTKEKELAVNIVRLLFAEK